MRTVSDEARVRLYHLDEQGGTTTTLLYGSLAEALQTAAAEPAEMQGDLWLQTSSDVVRYLDLIEGESPARLA